MRGSFAVKASTNTSFNSCSNLQVMELLYGHESGHGIGLILPLVERLVIEIKRISRSADTDD
jgi:hypothetical protein